MDVSIFDYHLPEEAIAQAPVEPRDSSRLMVVDRTTGLREHTIFRDIKKYLRPDDLLVLNRTRVLPARLLGRKEGTDVEVEFVLLTPRGSDQWEVLVRPGRRLKQGAMVSFADGLLRAEILDYTEFGGRKVKFFYQGNFEAILNQVGEMPLPPYISRSANQADRERYQTVYAQETGSAAAPTAGLHFTPELLTSLKDMGVEIATVLLHVGLGTFRPVQVERVEEHTMHAEFFNVDQATVDAINKAKKKGRRVIAVGTTSVRTLESATKEQGIIQAGQGWTNIFIYPGYQFKVVDGIITNFHLPRSTLLMLISAFAGQETVLAAYKEAVSKGYRFFSYGDAMLLV